MKKNIIGVLVSLMAGGLLGFFGVLNSVFSDAGIVERIITILVILVLYGALSAACGYFIPRFARPCALILTAPGIVFLLLYMMNEFNLLFIPYAAGIGAVSWICANGGKRFGDVRNRGNRS